MKNLRHLRKNAGLSQQQLANELGPGLTQPQIQNYETGAYEPDIETMMQMADYFDTSVDYLVGRTIYKEKLEAVGESNLTEVEHHLVSRYRRLQQNQRRSLIMFLDSLDGA